MCDTCESGFNYMPFACRTCDILTGLAQIRHINDDTEGTETSLILV